MCHCAGSQTFVIKGCAFVLAGSDDDVCNRLIECITGLQSAVEPKDWTAAWGQSDDDLQGCAVGLWLVLQ